MKGKLLIPISLLAFVMGLGSMATMAKEKAKALYFDISISEDATPFVLSKIMASDDIGEIKFQPGTYHFYPDKGLEKFCRISNHNDVFVATAFPLINKQNITIDGQGATFIFHGKMIPFIIEDSHNITIKNLSIDWYMPFHSEGKIIANDPDEGTFDMEIADEYPYEIRDGQLVFIKEYYEHTIGQSILYDPQRKAIMFDTEAYTPLTTSKRGTQQNKIETIDYKYKVDLRSPELREIGTEHRIRSEQIRPGVVRIHGHGKKLPPIGMIMAMKGEQGENRLAPAIRLVNSTDFEIDQVTIYHAGGMGLIAENSENIRLDRMKVTPSGDRMVSTTADATHFVGCRGKIEITNCLFENQLDDASNIHGTYQEIVEVIDEHTLGIRMGHYQQQGFVIGRPGDQIGLVRLSDSFFPYEQLTLTENRVINGRYQVLIFKERIPKGVQLGDLIENINAYPTLVVDNCQIQGNRARGLLLSTTKPIQITNNYFHTEMEAILVPVESGHWYESGSARDLLIKNNTFENCVHSGQNRGVIRFVTDDEEEHAAFENIRIVGNIFKQFDHLILEINNVDKLQFKGNRVFSSDKFPKLHPENPMVKINFSKNINFSNNSYRGDTDQMVESVNSSRVSEFR
ncbi:right-handed parallel beta-helix repeat-containing protein [Echinicola sediminis]